MKATIERATLLKSLGHVQSVVERRNTIPILSNVLIEARDDGSLRVMATDLDLQVMKRPRQVSQRSDHHSPHFLRQVAIPEGSRSKSAPPRQYAGGAGRAASISPPCRATISR